MQGELRAIESLYFVIPFELQSGGRQGKYKMEAVQDPAGKLSLLIKLRFPHRFS